MKKFIIPFDQITMEKIESVGEKNVSWGEMINNLTAFFVQYGIDSVSFNANALFKGNEGIFSAERMFHHSLTIALVK